MIKINSLLLFFLLGTGSLALAGEALPEALEDVRTAVATETRKNAPHRDRRIRKRLDYLFEELDERVSPVVTKERREGYRIFKHGLAEQMRPDR